jgi:hypothetical protein
VFETFVNFTFILSFHCSIIGSSEIVVFYCCGSSVMFSVGSACFFALNHPCGAL